MLLYFAYGSNMSRARLQARVGEVRVLGWASAEHYRHAFDKHGADGTAKGNIVRAPGETVHGVLFELRIDPLEVLTAPEGGSRGVELSVLLRSTDALCAARSFEAIHRVDGLAPSPEYLDHYRRGMEEHDLPSAYRAAILFPY